MIKEVIKSKQNNNVKLWKKLLTSKGRQHSQTYMVEGIHLVQEAIKSNQLITQLILREDFDCHLLGNESQLLANLPTSYINHDLAKELSATMQPQGIFALIKMPDETNRISWQGRRYLLVDGVQDPGNLGTIIRTADAAGYDGIVLGDDTVDLYNDKVIRSTQGSLWHLPIIRLNLEEAIKLLQLNEYVIYSTALHQQAQDYREINTNQSKMAIIVGNEGNGVSQKIIDLTDASIFIPMYGKAESLNVGIAAGILMFHFC